jgi:hypothetical protein
MQKSSLPLGIRALKNNYEKGTLLFDNPIQRAASQWSLLQKSLLVHSILASFPIPNVYFLKSKNEDDTTIYSVLDAKQRLSSIFEFIDGEFALHTATPSLIVDGNEIELANMKFEDLSEDCKDEIMGYRFSIYCIEDATDEEVEEIFSRLNNSTPLSPIQKCRSVIGMDMSKWLRGICESDFIAHSVCLTVAQARREADLEVVLQSMLLLDARHEGYEYKSISTAEVTRYCSAIRDSYNDDKKLMFEQVMGYLSEAFAGERHKFLRKSNVPMVVVLAKVAMEKDIVPADFKVFIDSFNSYENPKYQDNMGAGNIKRQKVEGRLEAIAEDFEEHFGIDGTNIVRIVEEGGADESED